MSHTTDAYHSIFITPSTTPTLSLIYYKNIQLICSHMYPSSYHVKIYFAYVYFFPFVLDEVFSSTTFLNPSSYCCILRFASQSIWDVCLLMLGSPTFPSYTTWMPNEETRNRPSYGDLQLSKKWLELHIKHFSREWNRQCCPMCMAYLS